LTATTSPVTQEGGSYPRHISCMKAISVLAQCRGGIPVCWPQFNDMGSGQAHGFARNTEFQVVELESDKATLRLGPSDSSRGQFPYEFELRIEVSVSDANGGTLSQTVSPISQDLLVCCIHMLLLSCLFLGTVQCWQLAHAQANCA
jgi:hypothetical protein